MPPDSPAAPAAPALPPPLADWLPDAPPLEPWKILSLGLPPAAPPLLPELDELLLAESVLGVGTPAAEAAPPALGTPRVGDELPPAAPLDPPEVPELPPALAPVWPALWPPAPAAPPLCPATLPDAPACDPELPLDEDAAPEEPLDPLCEPVAPPLLEDTPPEEPDEPELLPEGMLLPDDPELPEDPELPLEEEEEEDEEDEELGEDAPPLLEEDCWLTQPPTRNADTVPTSVPCAASTRMRRIAPRTLRSDVSVFELLACIVDSPGSHP